jgi:hypothetical protein
MMLHDSTVVVVIVVVNVIVVVVVVVVVVFVVVVVVVVVGVGVSVGVVVVRANSHSPPSIRAPCTKLSKTPWELWKPERRVLLLCVRTRIDHLQSERPARGF